MKFTALSASALAFALALVPTGLAGPLPTPEETKPTQFIDLSSQDFNSTTKDLIPRSGTHSASFYSSGGCGGTNEKTVSGFGCGGTCYTGFSAASVQLNQQSSGNPKPTASMFTSGDCSGSSQSVGIASGQTSGCTNNAGNNNWQSAYLYFNC